MIQGSHGIDIDPEDLPDPEEPKSLDRPTWVETEYRVHKLMGVIFVQAVIIIFGFLMLPTEKV